MPVGRTVIITPNTKPLPFPGGTQKFKDKGRILLIETFEELGKTIEDVAEQLPQTKTQYIVVEDFSHYFHERIMSPQFVSMTAGNAAFDRYNILARDVMNSIFTLPKRIKHPRLKIVLIHHTEDDKMGKERFRTFGQLLKEKLDPQSYVRIILHSRTTDKKKAEERYVFQTNDDGVHEAKTPMGMFDEQFIANDLFAVLKRIDEYDGVEEAAPAEKK